MTEASKTLSPVEAMAKAIGDAELRYVVRRNKLRDDGCFNEIVRVSDGDPVLVEAYRNGSEAEDQARKLNLEHMARAALSVLAEVELPEALTKQAWIAYWERDEDRIGPDPHADMKVGFRAIVRSLASEGE